MTANTLLARMAARGVRITLDGDNLKIDAPSGMLTDEDRHQLKCYKAELLWRLRHPEGDPPASGYQARMFIGGEEVRVPLGRLIAEGKEIIEREDLQPKTLGLDPDMWAASVALERYDEGRILKIGAFAGGVD
jgi:hypothetical protein